MSFNSSFYVTQYIPQDVYEPMRRLKERFDKATRRMRITESYDKKYRSHRGSRLYKLQSEFSYAVDEIQRGPVYMRRKILSDLEEMVEKLENEK